MLTERQSVVAGQRIVEMLQLTKTESGRYNTTWGEKTVEGLGRCFQRVIEEAQSAELIKE